MKRRTRRPDRRAEKVRPARPALERLERRQLLATIAVTTLQDAVAVGDGVSLREAIQAINAGSNVSDVVADTTGGGYGTDDRIVFDGLAGTIALSQMLGDLPAIAKAVTVDGATGQGFAGSPVLAVDGSAVTDVITISGPNVTIRSLAVVGGGGVGVQINGPSATGDRVVGSYLGLRLDGAKQGNNAGLRVGGGATGATIGGATAADRNLISGNAGSGVRLEGGATGVLVLGNFIGTDPSGTIDRGNGGSGVSITSTVGNTVGGVNAVPFVLSAGNLISGNDGNGVRISGASSSGNVVLGNFLGTDAAGTAALPNGISPSTNSGAVDPTRGHGVLVDLGATGNRIGGGIAGAGNLASGNYGSGVLLDAATGNLVQGNRAGTNAAGTAAVPNGIETLPGGVTDPQGSLGTGIRLRNGAVGNTIGGVADVANPAVGNLASGNIADGIGLSGASTSANLIIGNRVGTGPAGTAALANELNGVLLDGATGNTVGGAAADRRNLIAGNQSDGVQISGGASGNVVLGNFVGVDVTGTLAIGNGDNGVFIDGSTNNTVGGLDPLGDLLTAGNVLSGNFDGVRVRGPGASGNRIVGNFIGTDATGTIDLGNRDDGVQLVSSDHNTVGGTATGAANLIASNTANGVVINNAGASANLVVGNLIGTDIAGTAGRGNGGAGVLIATSAVGNTIGGLGAAGNLISRNAGAGVRLLGPGVSGNIVFGNTIGTDRAGTAALANAIAGVFIDGTAGNTIGAPNAAPGALGGGNLVSGNDGPGIRLLGAGASANAILGNFVGTTRDGASALGNGGTGVVLDGAPGNTIGGASAGLSNLVSGNLGDGVDLASGASGNLMIGNRVGTDFAGAAALGNAVAGVDITAPDNTIGGAGAAGNLVSANVADGFLINGDAATGNLLIGNLIGTGLDGASPLGNGGIGVHVTSAANVIGAAGLGNVIADNAGAGVDLSGSANLVVGNRIGTGTAGTSDLGNGGPGVALRTGADGATVGGAATGDGNVVLGNAGDGVLVQAIGALVAGNFVGVNPAGLAIGNDGYGVAIRAAGADVGGTATGDGNVVSGNRDGGILVAGPAVTVLGNTIGLDPAGAAIRSNGGDGIRVEGGPDAILGGNVVSGNAGAGIRLAGPGDTGVAVLGNTIGTDAAGTAALGNGGPGLVVASAGNTIGGAGVGNLVAGNRAEGVVLDGAGASGNLLTGNRIGAAGLGNAGVGLRVGGGSNTIGGSAGGLGNTIAGNGGDGVSITGPANLLLGNTVGLGSNGAAAPNNGAGVVVLGVSGTTIGGTADGARNVISGNAGPGVRLTGTNASGNLLIGNRIGTDAAGAAARPNGQEGIVLLGGPAGNTIGGAATGSGNVISGNAGAGIRLTGPNTSGNALLGNVVGEDAAGTVALGNGGDGIRVDGAPANVLSGNVVGGNGGAGVALAGAGATGMTVRANRIGLAMQGANALGNGGGGLLVDGAPNNTVGGTASGAGNIVSGNGGDGVRLTGAGASANLLIGNLVGTGPGGTIALGNAGNGIIITGGAGRNTVGGVAVEAGNLVSGNRGDGVVLDSGAAANVVLGNLIGVRADANSSLANGGSGVRISGASGNTIGGAASNLISGNAAFGVAIGGTDATGNRIAGNLIGVDAAGTVAIGGQIGGVVLLNAPGNTIDAGNVIAGHLGDGLALIGPGATGNRVDGNFIGTDEAAREGLGNARGVFLDGAGGNTFSGNVVSGNRGDGFSLIDGASGNLLTGNLVGVAGTAQVLRPNLGSGALVVGAPGNRLDANVLSGNRGFGLVAAASPGLSATNNKIGVDRDGKAARPNVLDGVMLMAESGATLSGNVIAANGLHGVDLIVGSSGNVVSGNLIGVDAAGTTALPNGGDGVGLEDAPSNRFEANLVSGNLGNGFMLIGGSTGNVLTGNQIGTAADGSTDLGNGGSGVLIAGGGTNALQDDVVSGNAGFGVALVFSGGNVVAGGFVGTTRDGTKALGNDGTGVLLIGAAKNYIINSVISANSTATGGGNLRIEGPAASGNIISGNKVGTDAAGSKSLDPKLDQVRTGSGSLPSDGTPFSPDRVTYDPRNDGIVLTDRTSANTIGGTAAGDANLISGNRIGIFAHDSSDGNVILGNRIGTNAAGASAVPNGDGVILLNAAGNTIGGHGAGARNVISGNYEVGVRITSLDFLEPRTPAVANVIAGNYIGTNAAGAAAVPNRQGVYLYGASNNLIGGGNYADPNGGGNLLSGNAEVGVQILNADTVNAMTTQTASGPVITPFPAAVGSVSSGNVVQGNRVGTNAAGTARLGNYHGVFINDAPDNGVFDNLISGNGQVGLTLFATNATGNTVVGNRIGTDINGNTGVGNGYADPNGLGTGLFFNQVIDGSNPIAPNNVISGNQGLDTRTRPIPSGPFVEYVAPTRDANGAVTQLVVRINGYLVADASRTLNPANYQIATGSGGSVTIGTFSYDEVARTVTLTPSTPIPADQSFTLTIVGQAPGGLTSRPTGPYGAVFLDGNLNSTAGSNYVQTFPAVSTTPAAAAQAAGFDALAALDELPKL